MMITLNVPGLQLPKGVTGILLLPDTHNEAGDSFSNVSDPDTKGEFEKKSGQKKTRKKSQVQKTLSSEKPALPSEEQFKDLWNSYAKRNGWTGIQIMGEDLTERFKKARKELTTLEMWETCLKGLERDPFFSGVSSEYKARPLTLFYKNRYMDFYNRGADEAVTGVDAIVADWGSKLASITDPFAPVEIPTMSLPLEMPTHDADKDS
jgi:hypothetical protein